MTEESKQWRDAALMLCLAIALVIFGNDTRPLNLYVAGFAAVSAVAVALMILNNRNR